MISSVRLIKYKLFIILTNLTYLKDQFGLNGPSWLGLDSIDQFDDISFNECFKEPWIFLHE